MKLTWDNKKLKEYIRNIQMKEKLTERDLGVISIYTSYLNGCYDAEHATKEEYKKDVEKSRIVKISEIRELVTDFDETLIDLLPNKLYYSIMNLIVCLGQLSFNREKNYFLKKRKISDDELINQSYQIFESISSEYNQYLDKIYENKLVKIRGKKDLFHEESFCCPDLINQVGHIFINPFDNDSELETVYNHELAHSILCLTNSRFYNNSNYEVLSETHSIYMTRYTGNYKFKKTSDLNYLKSNYNYSLYIMEIIAEFNILLTIKNMKNLTRNGIIDEIYKEYGIEIKDFDAFFTKFLEVDAKELLNYLVSAIAAYHLLDLDFDKSKILYASSMFEDYKTVSNFFKKIDFDLKDEYYACDLFNRTCCNDKEAIRIRK